VWQQQQQQQQQIANELTLTLSPYLSFFLLLLLCLVVRAWNGRAGSQAANVKRSQ
jgi:hypothetical protein